MFEIMDAQSQEAVIRWWAWEAAAAMPWIT